jgi:WD40 repeat protein
VIGPYKLLEQIGEGGFGVVFLAEQQQPVRRKVALQVLKPGMDTRQMVARFEAERQALALMDHANIAHVLDAGATERGRPYFVMELVRGVPITPFCDANRLAPRQRLELFVAVCQAVQHAHQKGIIHRDLKPSNVLVTLHDGVPVVKVIDFGIAKALGQRLTDKTLFTGFAQMLGTPLYMSPEQAELSGLGVDTRSDIYTLGVLLYELLTGTTPFDQERLRQVDFDELRRILREEEPPKPSTRISTLGQAAATVSTNRQSEPKKLCQLLRGELDWVVMKALEKDRARRYETASAFAADVQRYLKDEPVSACPPSVLYRFRKFARRHKALLVTAALLAFLVGLGMTEATGMTSLAAMVIRAFPGGGTTVSEVDDRTRKEQTPQGRFADGPAGEVCRLEGHTHEVFSLAFSPNGRRILVGNGLGVKDGKHVMKGSDHGVRLYDLETGRELCCFRGHTAPVLAVAFAADGRHALSSCEGFIRVWDLQTGNEVRHFEGYPGKCCCAAFSADGRRALTGGIDRRVRLWDVDTGRELRSFTGPTDAIWSVALSPDGSRVLAGCGGGHVAGKYVPPSGLTLRLWDADSGEELHRFGGYTGHVICVAFSPDGRFALSGGDPKGRLWEVESGELLRCFEGHIDAVGAVAFSPDGRRALSAAADEPDRRDGSVRLWDVPSGTEVRRFPAHPGGAGVGVFSPDGRYALSGGIFDGTVRLWRLPP